MQTNSSRVAAVHRVEEDTRQRKCLQWSPLAKSWSAVLLVLCSAQCSKLSSSVALSYSIACVILCANTLLKSQLIVSQMLERVGWSGVAFLFSINI